MTKLQKSSVWIPVLGLAAVSALGLSTAPAFGGEAKSPNGLQVVIDPATGKIRQPTAEESRALLAPLAAAKSSAPVFTEWADGTISMVLTEEYLNVWLVGVNANGSISPACVDGYQAGSVQPATPAMEEK